MIQKEQRKQAHRIAVSFEQEVGGSDPAVWEAEVREAEAMSMLDPQTHVPVGMSDDVRRDGTPRKSPTADAAQWQYRSATKQQYDPPDIRSSGKMKPSLHYYGDGEEDEEDGTEEAEQYAAFLQAQADEDRLLAEYANDAAPYDQTQRNSQLLDADGDEPPLADTPGAELGIEMQGFTWEDAPLSDEEQSGKGMDVEMT